MFNPDYQERILCYSLDDRCEICHEIGKNHSQTCSLSGCGLILVEGCHLSDERMWARARTTVITAALCFSLVECRVGPRRRGGRCEAGQVDLISSQLQSEAGRVSSGQSREGVFCHGVLLLDSYLVLPAHCVVAARHLAHFTTRYRGRSLGQLDLGSVVVHPEFRLMSYDGRDLLSHDIAIAPIRQRSRRVRHGRRGSISLAGPDHRLKERRKRILRVRWPHSHSHSHSQYFLSETGVGHCHPAGLPPGQLCLTGQNLENNASKSTLSSLRDYVEVLDPGQGYYRAACLHTSGLAVLQSSHCRLEALVLLSGCHLGTVVALDLSLYRDWLRAAVLRDILKHRQLRRRRNYPTRGLFLQELRNSKACPPLAGKDVQHLAVRQTNLATSGQTVVPQPPQFSSVPVSDLRVITDCGVEIRLEAGVIQSPIHYHNVHNYSQLLGLLGQDFKYRPGQRCEWLITAPRQDLKVGLRFQYFDLHPHYDRLEVEGEDVLEDARPDVAQFRGGEQPRTIISGTDRLRLTFYSDFHQERRGFALTFQPVRVSQCGGYYAGDSGVVQSPNYPFYYPPNALCIWKIQVRTKLRHFSHV